MRFMKDAETPPDLPRIRYLKVVGEVFRLGRIGEAADIANVSQPAATQALARIEEVLGVPLFERRPGGMIPTEAGALFQPRLARTLAHLSRGDSLARRRAGPVQGKAGRRAFFFPDLS